MYKFINSPYIRHPFFEADKGGGTGSSGSDGDSGQEENAGKGDDPDTDDVDEGGEDDPDEKKYSQKDVDAAVEKRLGREKRKWQREQREASEKRKDGKEDNPSDKNKDDKPDDSELIKERKKNEKLMMRLACFDAGVSKESVKDVTALAKAYMEEDEDLDFEDAIEEVLKKYPQFKEAAGKEDGKSWGQRQKGKGAKGEKSMEDEISEALFGK